MVLNRGEISTMSRCRLLVVDDDIDVLRSVALMLSLEGYCVMTANSGTSASVLLSEHKFDVVITDLRMPVVDGYEIVKRTRQKSPCAGIIVTSRYIDEQAQKWIDENGLYGLEKPYNIHQISTILRDYQLRVPDEQ